MISIFGYRIIPHHIGVMRIEDWEFFMRRDTSYIVACYWLLVCVCVCVRACVCVFVGRGLTDVMFFFNLLSPSDTSMNRVITEVG